MGPRQSTAVAGGLRGDHHSPQVSPCYAGIGEHRRRVEQRPVDAVVDTHHLVESRRIDASGGGEHTEAGLPAAEVVADVLARQERVDGSHEVVWEAAQRRRNDHQLVRERPVGAESVDDVRVDDPVGIVVSEDDRTAHGGECSRWPGPRRSGRWFRPPDGGPSAAVLEAARRGGAAGCGRRRRGGG